MPEGPSLIIAKEEMSVFIGKKIISVSGRSKIEQERLVNKKLLNIRTWGKHLLLEFKGFNIRVHFLMFGKYLINEKKDAIPMLSLEFSKGSLNFYAAAIKLFEENVDDVYDFTSDVLSDTWNPRAATKKLKSKPGMIVADALLDQQIFSGVGNIIKNEVLYRIRVHPASLIGALPPKKLSELVKQARMYSFDFLEWKKEFVLKKHWLAHTKKICSRDGNKIQKEYLGKTARRSFFCEQCQVIYT